MVISKPSGRARYTADVQLPGMLYARFVNATVPHGKVVSIDTSAAEKSPRSEGRYVIETVLGNAVLRDPSLEQSKYPIVRYAGQPIAAVAATTPYAAEEAAAKVKVKYAAIALRRRCSTWPASRAPRWSFPARLTRKAPRAEAAARRGTPQTGNVHGPSVHKHGDAEQGFKDADVVVDARYTTQVQTHSALETHGVVADWKPDLLTVYASTQGTASVREELCRVLQTAHVAKSASSRSSWAAASAPSSAPAIREWWPPSFPAKPALRFASCLTARKNISPSAIVPAPISACASARRKTAPSPPFSSSAFGTAGCGTGAGCAGPATNLYKWATLHVEENDVFTNAGPAAAFRAPGHPQGAFALEQSIDELADRLNMDPLDLRDRMRRESSAARAAQDHPRTCALWKSRNPKPNADPGPFKRGVGLSQSIWYRHLTMSSSAEVRVHKDGSVEVMSAVQDIGSGIKTAMAQILAEQFGVPPAKISVKIGDTNYPVGPNSGGSVTTASLTPAVRDAAWQAAQKFLAAWRPALGTTPADLSISGGMVRSASGKLQPIAFRSAAGEDEYRRGFRAGQAHPRLRRRASTTPTAASMWPK